MPAASLRELSMGMSHDLEAAVAEGATMVRVGTAIFGKRTPPAAPNAAGSPDKHPKAVDKPRQTKKPPLVGPDRCR